MRLELVIIFSLCLTQVITQEIQVLQQPDQPDIEDKLFIGQDKEILTLPDYGVVINHQLTYFQKITGDWPCIPERQKVQFSQPVSKEIITEISQENFESHFTDGVFEGFIPKILAFAHLENAAAVITSTGFLHIVSIKQESLDEKPQLDTIYSLELVDHKTIFDDIKYAFLTYNHRTKDLIFVSNEISLLMRLEDDTVITVKKIFQIDKFVELQAVVTVEEYVCMALGKKGVECFKLKHQSELYSFESAFRNRDIDATDVRVINFSDQTFNLYVLDYNSGVIIYQLIIHGSELLTKQVPMQAIGQKYGVAFDIYRNSLMMIKKGPSYYTLHDYHIDLEKQSWVELNRWVFQSEVKDIDLTEEFAIVIGHSGHHIIYHSVHKDFYKDVFNYNIDSKSESTLYLPNLVEVDFLAKDLEAQHQNQKDMHSNIIFGITRHKLVALNWQWKPITIRCQTDNSQFVDYSHIQMTYQLNSTQCPIKKNKENDMMMCTSRFYFDISFKKPVLNRNGLYMVVIVVVTILVLLAITVGLIIRKYWVYRVKRINIESEISVFEKEGLHVEREEIPVKQSTFPTYRPAQIQSNMKTPYSEDVIEQQ